MPRGPSKVTPGNELYRIISVIYSYYIIRIKFDASEFTLIVTKSV